jgi:hypothetical protein
VSRLIRRLVPAFGGAYFSKEWKEAFAQFERELIRERQREGIAIARREGKYTGRKPSLLPARAAKRSWSACGLRMPGSRAKTRAASL